jgi:hypothetical protein
MQFEAMHLEVWDGSSWEIRSNSSEAIIDFSASKDTTYPSRDEANHPSMDQVC